MTLPGKVYMVWTSRSSTSRGAVSFFAFMNLFSVHELVREADFMRCG